MGHSPDNHMTLVVSGVSTPGPTKAQALVNLICALVNHDLIVALINVS